MEDYFGQSSPSQQKYRALGEECFLMKITAICSRREVNMILEDCFARKKRLLAMTYKLSIGQTKLARLQTKGVLVDIKKEEAWRY